MALEAFKRYRATLTDYAEIELETDKVSFEVSYLREADVEMTGLSGSSKEDFKNDFERAQWGNKGAQWIARVKPGTEIIVQYISGDLFHILGSDDPGCMRVVGEATLPHLKNISEPGVPPQQRRSGKIDKSLLKIPLGRN